MGRYRWCLVPRTRSPGMDLVSGLARPKVWCDIWSLSLSFNMFTSDWQKGCLSPLIQILSLAPAVCIHVWQMDWRDWCLSQYLIQIQARSLFDQYGSYTCSWGWSERRKPHKGSSDQIEWKEGEHLFPEESRCWKGKDIYDRVLRNNPFVH